MSTANAGRIIFSFNEEPQYKDGVYFIRHHGILLQVIQPIKVYGMLSGWDLIIDSTWPDYESAKKHCDALNEQYNWKPLSV